MTETIGIVDRLTGGEPRYLLLKRGLYYRPDNAGYTGIKDHAGRYLASDASPESGVTAMHEDDAPDFSAGCFDDLARAHLAGKLAKANATITALAGALEAAPLPSTMGTAEEHYRRFYDWLKNVADPALALLHPEKQP